MLRRSIVGVVKLCLLFFFLRLLRLDRVEMDRTSLTFLFLRAFLLHLLAFRLTPFSRLSSRCLSTVLGFLLIFSIFMLGT